jgi:hypothetical protein
MSKTANIFMNLWNTDRCRCKLTRHAPLMTTPPTTQIKTKTAKNDSSSKFVLDGLSAVSGGFDDVISG